jgi:hypothetical protein
MERRRAVGDRRLAVVDHHSPDAVIALIAVQSFSC